MAVATKMQAETKPVAIIAVNSGNPRGEVQGYLRQNNIKFPAIVDANRSFEKQAGVGEVSLQNVWQTAILTPDGQFRRAFANQPQDLVNQALAGAKWNVDPTDLPDVLKPAWLAIEFGNVTAAARDIKRYLTSRKEEEKAGAEKLNGYVAEAIKAQYEVAQKADAAGEAWKAYKGYQQLIEQFKGYDVPQQATDASRTLAKDDNVKAELLAMRQLEGALKQLSSPSASTQKRGLKTLETLVSKSAETEAGGRAKAILEQINQAPPAAN